MLPDTQATICAAVGTVMMAWLQMAHAALAHWPQATLHLQEAVRCFGSGWQRGAWGWGGWR